MTKKQDVSGANELGMLIEMLGETPRGLERRAGLPNGTIQKKTSGARRGSALERLLVRAAVRHFAGRPRALRRFIEAGMKGLET